MKSEFILAFNEICESRGLPKEDVFEALKTALVSAYRRDMNISSNQEVVAEIDPRTGEPTIFSEKEVVDDVMDDRTEVLLSVARAEGHTDAQLGDVVMVDSTTPSFGRIAAQTAKQVLLQRVREAEREHLFEDFSGREGELVNGTVQSISGQHITIGLGRTEAIMPKSQQVPGERARAHDKIRVYVLEVRRTSRGPQIVVSRNHRNLLRRLLELEVPEIYNGQVEIKSIAREAGQRSKVAVQALQPGVDPVGACVGMRGVRIQSIVRELNDEKIDVIEWDPDQRVFIAKALSPARVSHVFLDEESEEGKTAVVIVPDDQLSLAIGREGQNARLAAKLTGWRIDIKSLTEAATESLDNLDDPAADPNVVLDTVFLDQVRLILDKKETGRPVTAEDYMALDKLVAGVEGRIVAQRAKQYEDVRRQRMEQRKNVPEAAWGMPLDDLDLPGRIHNLLLDASVETVGDLMFVLEMGDETFLNLRGLGDQSLDTVKETLQAFAPQLEAATAELERQAAEEAAAIEAATPVVEEAEIEEEAIVFGEDTLMMGIDMDEAAPPDDVDEAQAMAEAATEAVIEESGYNEVVDESGDVVEVAPDTAVETEQELENDLLAQTELEVGDEPAGDVEPEPVSPLDDLSKSLIEPEAPAPKPKQPELVIVTPSSDDDEDEDDPKRKKRKGRALVYDEDLDAVVVKRKRKKGRSRPEWEDIDIDDIIDEVIDNTSDDDGSE